MAALAVLSGGGVLAQSPKPGVLESYGDWVIGCDNRNRCEAISLLPDGAPWPDAPMMVGVVRDAGPDSATEVWLSRDGKDAGQASFLIDGRKVASVAVRDGEARVRGPQASALAIAMARGSNMEIRAGMTLWGRISLAGSGAALRYMDARQGRAGTVTALVATGPLAASVVKAAPAAPAIRRAVIASGAAPAALWREELTRLGRITGCTQEMADGRQQPELHRLSGAESLILVPCGAGAYNFSTVPVIASGVAGRRSFRIATFDFAPGWGEEGGVPMLVNAGWTPDRSALGSYAKGRGIGDCGGSQTYVWDGRIFRLAEATAMNECRGAWRWITTWTTAVTP